MQRPGFESRTPQKNKLNRGFHLITPLISDIIHTTSFFERNVEILP